MRTALCALVLSFACAEPAMDTTNSQKEQTVSIVHLDDGLPAKEFGLRANSAGEKKHPHLPYIFTGNIGQDWVEYYWDEIRAKIKIRKFKGPTVYFVDDRSDGQLDTLVVEDDHLKLTSTYTRRSATDKVVRREAQQKFMDYLTTKIPEARRQESVRVLKVIQ